MKYLLFICLSFFLNLSQAQETINSSQREIVFRSVNVIPMEQERVIANQDVVVKNGTITAIGNSGSVKYPSVSLVIDGKGKFLMPGLAEMHAHGPTVNDIEPM